MRLALEPERLQARVEGFVVEAAPAVLAEDGVDLGRALDRLGEVQADGAGLGETRGGGPQRQRQGGRKGQRPEDQPWVPVRAT